MPITVDAVVIRGKGGPEVLGLETIQIRDPGPGEVRVRVHAAGLNRADTLQRRGFYPAPRGAPADVPGLEFAGEVEAVGEGVFELRSGDRVMGICAGGGMAGAIVAHERELVRIPERFDFVDAAAIPEVFMTAFDALFLQGGLRPGMSVLLHAAASGIGTAGAQLAKSIGARAYGTLRTAEKIARLEPFGFDGLVVAEEKTFEPTMRELAPGGVDVILDTVGAAYLDQNVNLLASGGVLVVIGMMGGTRAELNLGALLAKRACVRGSVLRSRPLEEKAALAQAFQRQAIPLFESGQLAPVVDEVFEAARIADAHRAMEENRNVGKIVIRFD
jgi:NADPH:quinone reductase